MTDLLLENENARKLVKTLGLPIPVPARLARAKGPYEERPLDDKKVYELFCQAQTSGLFQFESDGMKDILRRLKPERFEDLIALNALFRPGPIGGGLIEPAHRTHRQPTLFSQLQPSVPRTRSRSPRSGLRRTPCGCSRSCRTARSEGTIPARSPSWKRTP